MHNEVIGEVETGGQQDTAERNQDNEIRWEVKIKVGTGNEQLSEQNGNEPKG